MWRIYWVVSFLLVCGGIYLGFPKNDPEGAEKTLTNHGYTSIRMTGLSFFGCSSQQDTFRSGFQATTPSGIVVTGTVCRGWLSGSQVRLD